MKRKALDPWAVAYPILITFMTRIIAWAQYRWFTKSQKKKSRTNQDRLEASMANALDGIVDIQTNNLQPVHLHEFDEISRTSRAKPSQSNPIQSNPIQSNPIQSPHRRELLTDFVVL